MKKEKYQDSQRSFKPRVGYYPEAKYTDDIPDDYPVQEEYDPEADDFAYYGAGEEQPEGVYDGQEYYDEGIYDEGSEFAEDDSLEYDEEEERQRRRDSWKVAAGVGDFFAVIAGGVVILLMIGIMAALISWVHGDLLQSFGQIL